MPNIGLKTFPKKKVLQVSFYSEILNVKSFKLTLHTLFLDCIGEVKKRHTKKGGAGTKFRKCENNQCIS